MKYLLPSEQLLFNLGYRKDIGYQKGWYRTIYTKNLTQEKLEMKSIGILYCGKYTHPILEDIKEAIESLGS